MWVYEFSGLNLVVLGGGGKCVVALGGLWWRLVVVTGYAAGLLWVRVKGGMWLG